MSQFPAHTAHLNYQLPNGYLDPGQQTNGVYSSPIFWFYFLAATENSDLETGKYGFFCYRIQGAIGLTLSSFSGSPNMLLFPHSTEENVII